MKVHYKVYVSPAHIGVMIPYLDLLYVNDISSTYGMLERYQHNKIRTANEWYFYYNSDYSDDLPSVYIYSFVAPKHTKSSAGGAL